MGIPLGSSLGPLMFGILTLMEFVSKQTDTQIVRVVCRSLKKSSVIKRSKYFDTGGHVGLRQRR